MRTSVWLASALGLVAWGCHGSREEPPPPTVKDAVISTPLPAPPARDAVGIPGGEFLGLQPFCIPGTFTPTSSSPSQTDSPHRHVDAYAIDRRPTSCASFNACVEAHRCRWVRDYDRCTDELVEVELDKATDYCAWVGGKLPTLDEWQRAARGIRGKKFLFDEVARTPTLRPGESYRYLGPEGVEFEMLGGLVHEFTRDLDCAVGSHTPDPNHAKPDRIEPVSVIIDQPRLDLAVPSSRGSHGFRCVYEDKAATQP